MKPHYLCLPKNIRILYIIPCLLLPLSAEALTITDPINGNSLEINYASTTPGIVDDGFGYKQKTVGGLTDWKVNGTDYLFSQSSFYRIGSSGPEISPESNYDLDDYSVVEDSGAGTITVKFDGNIAPIKIEQIYTLQGAQGGGGPQRISQIIKDVKVTNKTGAAIDLAWFEYTDLDLSSSSLDVLSSYLHAGTRVIDQNDFYGSPQVKTQAPSTNQDGNFIYTEPSAFELDSFGGKLVSNGGQPTLLDSLLDDMATNLTSSPDILFPNDSIFGLQYNFTDVNDFVTMRTVMTLQSVPEPSSLLLLGLGFAVFAGMRGKANRQMRTSLG